MYFIEKGKVRKENVVYTQYKLILCTDLGKFSNLSFEKSGYKTNDIIGWK